MSLRTEPFDFINETFSNQWIVCSLFSRFFACTCRSFVLFYGRGQNLAALKGSLASFLENGGCAEVILLLYPVKLSKAFEALGWVSTFPVSKLSNTLTLYFKEFLLQLKIYPLQMGPSCKRKTRSTRKSRRTIYKKQKIQFHSEEAPAVCSPCTSSTKLSDSPPKIGGMDFGEMDTSNSPCATPKAQKFRIPEIKTCPPAPKKQRVLSSYSSIRRTPITFFAPPDLELFFFVALRDVWAWSMSVINRE